MKKITVIMPVYNAERVLNNTIDCISGQTFLKANPGDMEVLAIDDASDDGSLGLLRDMACQHKWLKVAALPENMGPGGARNAALEVATGEYLCFVDSDDTIDPTMLEKLYLAAKNGTDHDIADCGMINDNQGGSSMFYVTEEDCGKLDDARRARLISKAGNLFPRIIRRGLIEDNHIRFREHVIMEDQDFMSEVFARADSVTLVPEILYRYHDTPGSASKKDAEIRFFENIILTIRAEYERLSVLPNYQAIKCGAESFFIEASNAVLETLGGLVSYQAITPQFADKMKAILKNEIKKAVSVSPDDNPFLAEKLTTQDRERLFRELEI